MRKYFVPLSAVAMVLVGLTGPHSAGAATAPVTWVAKPMCARARPGRASCHAMELVAERLAAGSAQPAGAIRHLAEGPAGGYTPAQVAMAYGLDVTSSAASTQTIAIVDAFDDPSVLSDLNVFNANYGLPAETATSFKVVNQTGGSTRPAPNAGWAAEITLDVQAVRGLCHKCKILLVETNTNSFADLAVGVNEAVALGAKVVSNSYGGAETGSTPTVQAAYDHQGVAIIASTGDDGWYDWDRLNHGVTSSNAPNTPAAYPTVVAVSGTSLYLNPDGTRADETVWNENGPNDLIGNALARSMGAAGGGCSTTFTARPFQQGVAGYSTLGCATKRSTTDIAAIADPYTGYDIYWTYGATHPGWQTFGGTSLASPVVAAMWGLAGGPGGVKYPALSLYGHFKSDSPSHYNDVRIGGTGLCNTSSPTKCSAFTAGNPNQLGWGLIDCGWAASGSAVLPNRAQCYARPGYDGVSGVGTPTNASVFKAMSPTAVIASPGTVTHNVAKVFSSAGSSDPFPGGSITTYAWNWGDGQTSTGASPSHTYTSAGARTITLTVTDNYGRTGTTTRNITVA